MIAIEQIEKLKKEDLGLITLITGEDIGQYSQMKELFMKRIAFDKDDLTYSYFDLSECSYQDAEMDLLSLPFFADEKYVVFDNCLDITTSKKSYLKDADLKAFEAYLEQPLETSRLIIFAPGKLDGKRRLVKLLKRDAEVLEANLLKEAEVVSYFQTYSHKQGLTFDNGVFDQLILKSNADFSQMMKNITFLKSYKKDGHIVFADIDEAIPKSLHDNIFDLTRFVGQKKVTEANSLVHDLRLSGEDEIKLIAIMIGQFRLLLQIALLLQMGKNEQHIIGTLSDLFGRKVNPYQVKYAIKDLKTVKVSFLKEAIKILIETDYQIKTGVYEKDYLFDIALLKLMTY
ncbi:DNA polymerase III subunit delta [Streptococcus iniae]|uniref:DNA polymerase III subunit delta n=1 Tax=Streptococcus iniae TaxID=1346 RepID=UPI0008DA720D|nr:DNA polymerase III subunit delta [Streptococcus iniae]OHX26540.1 DNA polymerase III subunit delta [Streptococcus iniae]RLV28197.1 DNA polymerase III subunit delta [Streptococcus iniae]